MTLKQMNTSLYKAEDLFSDNLITRIEYNNIKANILDNLLLPGNEELRYDDEINQIYREKKK